MTELKMDGTVRSLTEQDVRKEDTEKEQGKVVVMNEDGWKATLVGPKRILQGLAPGEQVVVSLKRANKTLQEATKKE